MKYHNTLWLPKTNHHLPARIVWDDEIKAYQVTYIAQSTNWIPKKFTESDLEYFVLRPRYLSKPDTLKKYFNDSH